ncbi:MAG: hypothetical protein PHX46_03355 [Bacilli bacterium]|nr:hypothetical protein [Bacilli bacterium]
MKIFKKIFKYTLLTLVIALIAVCTLPYSFVVLKQNEDFSSIMYENIYLQNNNPKIVEVAMLGAHDAFSSSINYSSEVDPAESGIVANTVVSSFLKGFIIRSSVAQKSDAEKLLNSGVRYLDVRISYFNDSWYTKHALISDKLEYYLLDILSFLNDNKGEFIVFDIQHVYLAQKTYEELFSYIDSVKLDGYSLFDYVNYESSKYLDDIHYNDVTNSATKGGVVILAKNNSSSNYEGKFFVYDNSIRSIWHDKIKDEDMLKEINKEYLTLKNDSNLDREKFRVNQAQKTSQINASGIFQTIFSWSLLRMAQKFNIVLVENSDFENWLEVMPIFMVDFSDSSSKDFNKKVIEKINNYNRELD